MISLLLMFLITTYSKAELVSIHNKGKDGTGFIVDGNKIVTNAHVCMYDYDSLIAKNIYDIPDDLLIKTENKVVIKAEKIYIMKTTDICVITTNRVYSSFIVKYHYKPKLNEVFTIKALKKFFDTDIKYIGKDDTVDNYTKYHDNSHISKGFAIQGMSGSPVLNKNGLVIGVFWGIKNKGDIVYYISVDELMKIRDIN